MSHWLVIGAGVSGLGAAKLLRARGHSVRVSEKFMLPPGKSDAFRAIGADLRDGGHAVNHLDGIVSVVVSPGLPPTHPLLVLARERGLPVVSEIDLALREYKGKVLAVTGTNGKSTTCAMLGHVLAKEGRSVEVGGNFGEPPSGMLAAGRKPDYLVLELSSYQLEQSELVAPEVAIFTSFSHDHMARHGSLAAYLAVKWKVFAHQPKGALALLPDYILEHGRKDGLTIEAKATVIDKAVISGLALESIGIREVHNQLNATFTLLALAHLLDKPVQALAPHLADFRGLPHRCELVGRIQGRIVVNDSKSTNVESTLVALQSQEDPVILMMGGQGKGESYGPILTEKARIAAVVTFGKSGPEIAKDLKGQVAVHEFPTLGAALDQFGGILEKYPRAVLFSPGCASFDEFTNYEHRGEVFRKAMAGLCDPSPTTAR